MKSSIKVLAYGGSVDCDNPLPKVKYEDIPEERRKSLRHKRLYKVSPEDFEEWLAVELDFNKVYHESDGADFDNMQERLADEEDQKSLAQYYRAEFRHLQEFAVWEKEQLNPIVKELAVMAKNDPQYDWHFLYKLEQKKLICMELYLSHSRVADKDGEYVGKKWLVLCIKLLDYILEYKEITKEQIRQMNIRNIHKLVSSQTIEHFCNESGEEGEGNMKFFYGKDIYVRKIEHLYYLIRLHYTRFWWE